MLPAAEPPDPRAVAELAALLASGAVTVISGAGCSTASGIPDYRGEGTARRARSPVRFATFVADERSRQRYWARSMIGWPRIAHADPNRAHRALARLEEDGRLTGLVTQNVDRLHHRAGSRRVVELHGALADVRCLQCGQIEDRAELQARLQRLNPGFEPGRVRANPDGDVELADSDVEGFVVAHCEACGGDLKPDVVFFGESVPRARVEQAYQWVAESKALLVIGSSLTVLSGYRFVKRAAELGLPVAVVNVGPTRGDAVATLKIAARASDALTAALAVLGASGQ